MKTVAELIAELSEFPPDHEVEICVGDGDCEVGPVTEVIGAPMVNIAVGDCICTH
jgi:hypothetical protein